MEQPKLTNVVGTPPLSSYSGMQTDSSIQATFAAKVAAAVGEGKKVSPCPPSGGIKALSPNTFYLGSQNIFSPLLL